MASRFIHIISIRENNDYCYQAMLHGHDKAKKNIIKKSPRIEVNAKEKDLERVDQAVSQYLNKMRENG